jgi:hypothetical protein
MSVLTDETKSDAITLPRGNPFLMTIDTNDVDGLKDHMADFGIGADAYSALTLAQIPEAALVERLNNIRLSDRVLILTDIDWNGAVTDLVIYNVRTAFSAMGGRTIFLL